MDVRALAKMMRGGSVRDRLGAIRTGRAGTRLAMMGAALGTGVLDELDAGPCTTSQLCERLALDDLELTEAFLQVLRASGEVRSADGRWGLTRRGRAAVRDDIVRATYEAFSDYHTGLYDGLATQLRGGPGRLDVAEKGELIARLSQVMDPFVSALVRDLVEERSARRVLDVGCGAGLQLLCALEAAPDVTAVGCDTDPAAAGLARRTLAEKGLSPRAEVVSGDVRELLASKRLTGPFDLVLMANVVYYVPLDERVGLLRSLADLLTPGGALVVVSTALTDHPFSRHFDLLLRAQRGGRMGLPDLDVLCRQLTDAGLRPLRPRRIAPGEPLTAVVAEA